MIPELVPLLGSHAVCLGYDRDDRHHLADAAHELQIPRLQLVGADEVDTCVIHVLELQLFQENALCGAALMDVLLPNKGQDLSHISVAVFVCQVIAVSAYARMLVVKTCYIICATGAAYM